jgi:hypothetical protein
VKLTPDPEDPQKPHPGGPGTTEAAHAMLNKTRAYYIEYAMWTAARILQKKGTVHSREVRDVMVEEKALEGYRGNDFWLGTAFNNLKAKGAIEWTMHQYKYSDPARNIHDREVKIWKPKEGFDLSTLKKPGT